MGPSESWPDEGSTERTHSEALALVWRLASELVRRHPTRLYAVHGYFNEMYDVVEIVDRTERVTLATLNANGTNTAVGSGLFPWTLAYSPSHDPRAWILELERRLELSPPSSPLPLSTPASLTVRWISAFLGSQVGGLNDWYTRFEFPLDSFDSAGDPTSASMPDVAAWATRHPEDQHLLTYLFVRGDRHPRLALSPDGDLWHADGRHQRLQELRSDGESMTALLLRTAPELLT